MTLGIMCDVYFATYDIFAGFADFAGFESAIGLSFVA